MRKLGLALLCVVGLGGAGEAPALDMAALPQAQAAREMARDRCYATTDSFANASAYMECVLGADKAFVTTAKVRDPKFYDNFALVVRKAVADEAARKIDAAGLVGAYQALWQELQDEVMAQQDDFMSRQVAKNNVPAMDLTVESVAQTEETEAMRRCAGLGKSSAERFECILKATRDYAIAVKFRDMYRLDTFAAKVRLAVADHDRGDITAEQLTDRYSTLYNALFVAAATEAPK